MADTMTTLFPPLDPITPTSANNKSSLKASMSASKDESVDGDDVLPPELARNFETLRSLLAKPDDDTKIMKRESDDESLNSLQVVKRRKEAEDLAIATALAVEREVMLLQNGIDELETLLAAAAQQNDMRQPEPIDRRNRFPSLPPLVPNDDNEYKLPENCDEDAANMVGNLIADGNYRAALGNGRELLFRLSDDDIV